METDVWLKQKMEKGYAIVLTAVPTMGLTIIVVFLPGYYAPILKAAPIVQNIQIVVGVNLTRNVTIVVISAIYVQRIKVIVVSLLALYLVPIIISAQLMDSNVKI